MRLYEITPLEHLRREDCITCNQGLPHVLLLCLMARSKKLRRTHSNREKAKQRDEACWVSSWFSGFSGANENNTHISLRQVFEQKIQWLLALLLFFFLTPHAAWTKIPSFKNTEAGGQRSRRVNFRSVVVDECAQATEPEVVLCVMRLLDPIFWKWPRYGQLDEVGRWSVSELGIWCHLFRSLLVAVSFKEFLSLPRGKKMLRMYKSPKGCEIGSTPPVTSVDGRNPAAPGMYKAS